MKLSPIGITILAFAFLTAMAISVHQNTVIVQQKTLIEDMVKKPACSNAPETDPAPELPPYELPLEQRTL